MQASIERVIRDAAFAQRLDSACEGHPHIPPLYKGRLTWIKDQLARKFDLHTSTETVRKWFAGEVKPRPDKIAMLAELLEVDVSWLQLGIDQNLAPRQRKVRSALLSGAVNIVAGLIQMDGGNIAYPNEDDRRAKEASVEFYAIIKGASYAINVALGAFDGNEVMFAVPAAREGTVVLGLIRMGMVLTVIEITEEIIDRYGHRVGGSVEVLLTAEQMKSVPAIQGFRERL